MNSRRFIGFLLLVTFFAWGAQAQKTQVPAVDPAEAFPIGEASTGDTTRNAFSHPLSTAPRRRRLEFALGNSLFRDSWVLAPASTTGRDGLGGLFNAISCSSCHSLDGRGRPHRGSSRVDLSMLFRVSSFSYDPWHGTPDPSYGGQLQPLGAPDVKGEVKIQLYYSALKGKYPDGGSFELIKPSYELSEWAYGALAEDAVLSPRVAPQLPGLGFIEALREEDLLFYADPEDKDHDGISGRAHWVLNVSSSSLEVGRFGWKAEVPTLQQQNAAAFNGDLGITSRLFPEENCTRVQRECLNTRSGGSPEIEDVHLEKVTLYTRLLAVPKRRNPDKPQILKGRSLFYKTQCASCHRPSYTTDSQFPLEELAGIKIWPYSDFLLHDMGDGLADDPHQKEGLPREWRTPPLWGIGLIPHVNGHSYLLHDGRARNIEEAILWHGGEAQQSREQFKRLSQTERQALIQFVESL